MRMRSFILSTAAALLFVLPGTAQGQGVQFGPELSWGGDTEIGVGGRVLVNIGSLEHWDFIGTFDVFFPDEDFDYWEINGNLAYNFLIEDVDIDPYVGGGLNFAHVSFDTPGDDSSDSELGINLFGGTKFRTTGITPFVELRLVIEAADQVVLTGGILF